MLVIAHALGHKALADVGLGGHAHAQTVPRVLFDETPFGAQQRATLSLAGAVEVQPLVLFVAVIDVAALRWQAPAEQREQGRLARAGLADNPQHFTGIQIETDVLATLFRTV
ncbi:hypothetical protein D3C73_1415190 [compost metagenome]